MGSIEVPIGTCEAHLSSEEMGSIFLNWSIVGLQCCASFRCTTKWFMCVYTHTHTHTYIYIHRFSSVMSDSLWPHGLQHARLPWPSPMLGAYSNSCPLSRWCHPTISSSVVPSPPALNLSQHQGLFKWVSSLHQVGKVLEFQLQHQSFQWTPRTDLL